MKKGNLIKLKAIIVLAVIFMVNFPASAFIDFKNPSIDAENLVQLVKFTSKHVKITGTVYSGRLSDNSKITFLNFGKNFNTSLSAVIYDLDMNAFVKAGISKPHNYFENKKVVIDGVIRVVNGKPEIVINSPKQIKIIQEAKPQI